MERKKRVYSEKEAYEKLAAVCAVRECCCYDVEKKWKMWEVEEDVRERILNRLVGEKFIDEERFARAFVKDKFRYNHWGKVRIQQELRMRKISQKQIEEALAEIDGEDNLEVLKELIRKKRMSVKGKNEYEIRGKLIRFALGKGFEMEDVVKVVGSMDECED